MKLRSEVEPDIEATQKIFSGVLELISRYDEACDNNDSQTVAAVIAEINTLTNKNITEEDLFEYWESESKEEVAFKFSIPAPIKTDAITRDELLEIIRRIQSFDGTGIGRLSVARIPPASGIILVDEYYLPLLERNFSYPEINELFERQQVNGEWIEMTTEEIADKILSHKPIEL